MSTEPPSLNSLQSTDSESFFVIGHVMEGLLQIDAEGALAGGVAERWELTDQGARFWLRKDARWSDGVAVTAKDFVFAWRTAVDPKTAAPYASVLYPIANARAINSGTLAPATLGVKAIGDYQLEVRFEAPCPYFLGLTAFMTYMPLRQDIYQQFGARYAAEANQMVYNGAYTLSRWIHGASLRMDKNPFYWGRQGVAIERLDIPYITSDISALLNLYRDGQIAYIPASLDDQTLEQALTQGERIRLYSDWAVIFLEYNHRPGRATAHYGLRHALQQVVDTHTIVNKVVTTPGNRPLYSIFPSVIKGRQQAFVTEHPPQPVLMDLEQARQELSRARAELGDFEPLVMLVTDTPESLKLAEYLQAWLDQSLGLKVVLDKQTFKQRIAKMHSGDFDMVLTAWGPDFDDPITYGNLFASWNDNNRGRYHSEEYDRLVAVADSTNDSLIRMDAMAKMQQILIAEAVILPLYERAKPYLMDPRLARVVRSPFGADPGFRHARILAE
ncbi:MAG: peptide ABC transporter substrate-binding protein [Pseudomonadales bacterium]